MVHIAVYRPGLSTRIDISQILVSYQLIRLAFTTAPTFTKAFVRVASLTCRIKVTANAQEVHGLVHMKPIDILGVQEVKSHLPISINGYVWLSGRDRFTCPDHHVGIGFPVKKEIKGLVSVLSRLSSRIHVAQGSG